MMESLLDSYGKEKACTTSKPQVSGTFFEALGSSSVIEENFILNFKTLNN